MSFWNDIFAGSDQPYPTSRTGPSGPSCGTSPIATPSGDGIFNQLFSPAPLSYPVPGCPTLPGTIPLPAIGGTAPVAVAVPVAVAPAAPAPVAAAAVVAPAAVVASAAVAAPAAASSSAIDSAAPVAATPAAPAPSPVTVVIAMPGTATLAAPVVSVPAATPAATVPTPTVFPTTSMPIAAEDTLAPMPACPTSSVSAADAFNPRFRAHHTRSTEKYVEELIDENLTARMITKEGKPIGFVVPEGCDSVEFSYGRIEVNPPNGRDSDLDQIVALGDAKVCVGGEVVDAEGMVGALSPGDTIVVTLAWRSASFVEMPANHLKATLFARFFKAETILPAFQE
jgi:hypothetical protein